VPHADPRVNRARARIRLQGEVPSPSHPPGGCPFHPRCPLARDVCRSEPPPLREAAPGHRVACHFAREGIWMGGELDGHGTA